MQPLSTEQRDVKTSQISRFIITCKLTANTPDILALWGAGSFDDMPDEHLTACVEFMEQADRCRRTPATEKVRRLRSQVLTLLNRLGKYATLNDWSAVNRYLLQKKICGKLLYMLNENELLTLVRKLRSIATKKDVANNIKPEPYDSTDDQSAAMMYSLFAGMGKGGIIN